MRWVGGFSQAHMAWTSQHAVGILWSYLLCFRMAQAAPCHRRLCSAASTGRQAGRPHADLQHSRPAAPGRPPTHLNDVWVPQAGHEGTLLRGEECQTEGDIEGQAKTMLNARIATTTPRHSMLGGLSRSHTTEH